MLEMPSQRFGIFRLGESPQRRADSGPGVLKYLLGYSRSPRLGENPPLMGRLSPFLGELRPLLGECRPKKGRLSPFLGSSRPKKGRAPPKEGGAAPKKGAASPKKGNAPPKEGDVSPLEGKDPHLGKENRPVIPPCREKEGESSEREGDQPARPWTIFAVVAICPACLWSRNRKKP